MSSSPRPGQLEASPEREVVFCHSCQEEWYREAHPTLECPYCESDITEIVSLPKPSHLPP